MTNPLRLVGVEMLPGESREGTATPVTTHPPAPFDRRARVIFETCREALLVVDDHRRYLRVNRAATLLLGAPAEQIIGKQLEDFTPREHWERLSMLWQQLRDDGRLEGDYEVLQGSGSRQPITFRASWHYAHGEHLIAALATSSGSTSTPAGSACPLTKREREILQLVANGYSNPEVASQLFLSPATVKTHLQNVYKKLGAADRASAVAVALRAGLIR